MQRPKVTLLTYPEPYPREELRELIAPLAGAYDVGFDEMREEGDLFGLDLSFVVQAVSDPTIRDLLIKPCIGGIVGALKAK